MSPLLKELHWLWVPECITFRLAVLAYQCQHNMAPRYLTTQLQQASNAGYRQHLRSSSSAMARCSSHRTCDHQWPCVQFNCSSCVEQFANGSAVFWVIRHFSMPPENWTVRAFLQLTIFLIFNFNFMLWTQPTLLLHDSLSLSLHFFCCGCNLKIY